MAQVTFTYPVSSIHGKVAEGQYFSNRNGKNLMATYNAESVKNRVPSDAQVQVREKFAQASLAARELLADDSKKAELQQEFTKAGSPGTLFGYVFRMEYAKLK